MALGPVDEKSAENGKKSNQTNKALTEHVGAARFAMH